MRCIKAGVLQSLSILVTAFPQRKTTILLNTVKNAHKKKTIANSSVG